MPSSLVLGIFKDEEELFAAVRSAREEGLVIHDTYTPYAVEGLDEAAGTPRSRLTYVCFFMGLSGLLSALFFQLWTTTRSWPLNVGGKSFVALPALIPATFELTILFAAVGTVAAFLFRSRLWPGRRAVLVDPAVVDDRFGLALERRGDSSSAARDLLTQCGAENVQEIEAES